MNRELAPGISLLSAITTFKPTGIYPVTGGVEVMFTVDGTLHLTIQ